MIYFFYLKGGEGMEIVWTCGEDDEGRVVKDIARKRLHLVSVKFSSVIHLTVDNYYLRGFGFISISV